MDAMGLGSPVELYTLLRMPESAGNKANARCADPQHG